MTVEICGVILAAGEGQRLRPLTELIPKALCPVGNLALLDHALRRLAGAGLTGPARVAVNAAYLADQVVAHVGDRTHLSVEPDGPLGTSGGVARLKDWIDGRGVLVGNADAYLVDPFRDPGKDIAALLEGWSGDTVRMLTLPCRDGETGGFSGQRFAGFSLMPWRWIEPLADVDSNLVRTVWRPAEAAGELELIGYDGFYLDTGTPADYLTANLHAAAAAVAANLHATAASVTADPRATAASVTADPRATAASVTPDPHTTAASVTANPRATAASVTADPHATGSGLASGPRAAGVASGSRSAAGGSLIAESAVVTGSVTASVIGAGAQVHGSITECVIWPGATVAAHESLSGVIRAHNGLTVPAA